MTTEPSWSGRSVPEPPPVTPSDSRRSRLSPTSITIGVLLALNLGGLAYLLAQRSDDVDTATESATTAVVEEADEPEPQIETTTSLSPTTTATIASPTSASPTSASPTTASPTTAAPATTSTTASAAADELVIDDTRQAVLSAGVLYLRGQVPSQEVADAITAKAAAVVGADNVVTEYEIDPDAPLPGSAPLYVEDVVLFPYGTAEINPAFLPLLDLGTTLMQQNPAVVVTVIAHTDSDGSPEFNQRLSDIRANTVAQYWFDQGIDPAQVVAIGRGETEPVADEATADGAQANRRAEFIIAGILD